MKLTLKRVRRRNIMEKIDLEKMRAERRAHRKETKWMKGLKNDVISNIKKFKPSKVEFLVSEPTRVLCVIRTNGSMAMGMGWSICSTLDTFDIFEGKKRAAERAIKALTNKKTSDKIREVFPNTWTFSQARRVARNNVGYKSVFVS